MARLAYTEGVEMGGEMKRAEMPAGKCTDSAIANSVQSLPAENVQNGAPEVVQVQIFRAKMRSYLERDAPVILGNSWHPRGIVLPLPRYWRYNDGRRKRIAKLRRDFEAALNLIQ